MLSDYEVMMIRLRQLQALTYVLSSRTMTAAAEMAGISQPAMSRLIIQLEEEVGCQLLRRDRGRLKLTSEGEMFYESAERVLASMQELNRLSAGLHRDPKGEVRLVSTYGLISHLIPTAISQFVADHPHIRLVMDVLNRPLVEEAIRERNFDIAVAALPVKSSSSLTIDSLGTSHAICVLPPAHPLGRKRVVNASDLANQPFVSAHRDTLLRQRIDEVFERLSIKRRLQFECNNASGICQLVSCGFGVSILHPFVHQRTDSPFISRPFEPKIVMEFAMFRKPPGESSATSDTLAKYIQAEAGSAGIRAPSNFGKKRTRRRRE